MMKILHITNNYPTELNPVFGVFVKEQIESLKALGVECDVFFINGREKGKYEYLRSVFYLKKYISDNNYTIIHCHHALSALVLMFARFIKYKNIKCIVSYQNDVENELGRIVYKIIRKSYKCVIFKKYNTFINDRDVLCLPNGVDVDRFNDIPKVKARNELGLEINIKYVLFVSSNLLRKQKRYDKFLGVLKLLRDRYGLEDVKELKLINVKRENVPLYINAADLHLLTSDYEGSPNSVKECMSCNTPVVSTNVGDVADLLKEIPGSYVSDDNSVDDMAKLAYTVLTDNHIIKSREILLRKKLDSVSIANRLINIYKSL